MNTTIPIKQSIDHLGNHLTISYEDQTIIYQPSTLQPIYTLPFQYQAISFLYQTGLFAIVSPSKPSTASIHDYKYKRHIKDIDFTSPILNLHYSRNILFIFSKQKIQGYDLSSDQTILYINVKNGHKSFHSYQHQTIHLGYESCESNFISHSIWKNYKFQLDGVEFEEGKYAENGEYFVLKVEDGLNVYTNNSLINIIKAPEMMSEYLFNPIIGKIPTISLLVRKRGSQSVNENGLELSIQSLFRLQDTESKHVLEEIKQKETNLQYSAIIQGKLYILHNSKLFIYSIQQ